MSGGDQRRQALAAHQSSQYRILPCRRPEGDWKLIWRTPLPQRSTHDIADDPAEKTNVADGHPEEVAALQRRANELAATMAKPMLLKSNPAAMKARLKLPPAFPDDDVLFGGDE